jgi:hypothetical protein
LIVPVRSNSATLAAIDLPTPGIVVSAGSAMPAMSAG